VITLESSGVTTITANGVSFDMVFVDGGSFTMGCVDGRDNNVYLDCASSESPSHQVTLTNGYYIGKFPVTQALWVAIMDTNPSYFPGDLNRPVERVSWDDIVNYFIPALNALTGRTFRLPTEAEWEFAARGGNDSDGFIFSGGNIIGDVAWYTTNSGSTTQAVGGKDPNELGLFDMSGNVYEWVSDWWSSTAYAGRESGVTDPTGPATGSLRVIRGGSWNSYARGCRVSYRSGGTPDNRNNNLLGFRLVLSL
ncbi:MAG: formylglycine-generating enzyme family protein, partial [Chitinispirillales bacterium]|jgi:formylglycine-generating enzyme required for sulfatase activity|nr:formylglycine-generating enzyme family protein [Chitinispirillales bacterium]